MNKVIRTKYGHFEAIPYCDACSKYLEDCKLEHVSVVKSWTIRPATDIMLVEASLSGTLSDLRDSEFENLRAYSMVYDHPIFGMTVR